MYDQELNDTNTEHARSRRNTANRSATAPPGSGCLNNETPFNLNEAVHAADRMILTDNVPRSDFDNGQNNQSHNPHSTVFVDLPVHNGTYQGIQGAGRTEPYSTAFAIFGAVEQSKLPKSGVFLPRLAGLNSELSSSRRMKKREFDGDVSRNSSNFKRPKPDPALLIDLTNNDTTVPIINLTDNDTDPLIDLGSDKSGTAKNPRRLQLPGITQPGQRSESPIIPSGPQSSGFIQQGQGRGNPIPPPKQQPPVCFTTKVKLDKVLLRFWQNQSNMNKNRDVLHRLWEADTDLRRMIVYNDLTNLSNLLRAIEDKTMEAIAMLRRQYGNIPAQLAPKGEAFQKVKKQSPETEISGSMNR